MRPYLALSLLTLVLTAGEPVFRQRGEVIEVAVDGKPFTAFHSSEKWDKPFLHPVISSSGEVVARGWPVDPLPGDSNDHIWHRGLWYAHGDVNGVDFWREKGRDQTGRLIPRPRPEVARDRISVDLDMTGPDGKRLGTLRQSFRFGSDPPVRWIDVEATMIADAGFPLKIGDTEEGTLGFRFTEDFRLDRGAKMRNSEGVEGRPVWGKRARWTDYSVQRNGKPLGVTMMDHPSNPRHPTYWHARHYGLNSANPFGVRDFTGDKAQDGSMTVPAGGRATFRYRVLIHEGGDPDTFFRKFAAAK
jgi:hypothetical protein